MNAKKIKNPLYVVTNDGKDVESAHGLFEMLIKKFGLEPVMEMVKSLIDSLPGFSGNYGAFLFLQDLIDRFVAFIESIKEKVVMFVPSLK